MGISKENYLKKMEKIWSVLRKESSGNYDDLESERLLLAYILGANIQDVRVVAEMRCPSETGSGYQKSDYSMHLKSGIQKLLTKAAIGIQKEKQLNERYGLGYRSLEQEKQKLERLLKDREREIAYFEDKIEHMVGNNEYNELVDDYNKLVEKNEDLFKSLGVLRRDNNKLSLENKKLQGLIEQLQSEKSIAIDISNNRKRALEEITGLYEQEKARADKNADALVKERSRPAELVVGTKVDNREVNQLQGRVSELLGEIQGMSTTISNMEKEISNRDGLLAKEKKKVQEKQEEIGELGLRVSELKKELSESRDELNSEIKGLRQKISDYEIEEKKVVPTLQQVVYRRQYQGKSITLSDSEIDRVVRCYLNGMSVYQIHIECDVAESSIRKIINCKYKALSASKRILSALHRVNGNWCDEKKEILYKLIDRYECDVLEKTNESEMLKQGIEDRVVNIAAYNQEVSEHKDKKSK